jgi:flavodoxin
MLSSPIFALFINAYSYYPRLITIVYNKPPMNILLIYATNSGSTYSVAKIIEEVLAQKHTVTLKQAAETNPEELEGYDAVILGSPSWDYQGHQGYPHDSIVDLTTALQTKSFKDKPFAVFGCGDSSYTIFCGAVDHLEKFVHDVEGRHLATPLKIDGFFFDLDTNTQKVEAWAEALAYELDTK